MSQARFQKQQREKAKRERAAAKSARREQRQNDAEQAAETPTSEDEEAAIVAELAVLHARFDDGEIDFEDFDARRTELISHLNI